jgi:hypothetical protein
MNFYDDDPKNDEAMTKALQESREKGEFKEFGEFGIHFVGTNIPDRKPDITKISQEGKSSVAPYSLLIEKICANLFAIPAAAH